MKYKIQECPKCKAKSFEVDEGELADAEGVIECENCGTMLEPLEQVADLLPEEISVSHLLVEMENARSAHKPAKRSPRAVEPKCKNQFLEDDGFCTMCGTNHFGGERKEVPPVSPLVSTGKAVVKSKEVYHQHVSLYAYDW